MVEPPREDATGFGLSNPVTRGSRPWGTGDSGLIQLSFPEGEGEKRRAVRVVKRVLET